MTVDLLIVDDEPAILHAFKKVLGTRPDWRLVTASSRKDALSHLASRSISVIVLDINLPDSRGLETFHAIRAIDSRVPIILMTGHGSSSLAIDAMKNGAFDYLNKPLELDVILEQLDRAVRSSQLMNRPAKLPDESRAVDDAQSDPLIGRCPAMQDVYKAIGRVASQDVTVLILGESGTGKELIARAIDQHSHRSEKPFLAINCGAIPENLIESELFGHERGAFTSADKKRIGKFEQCDGGTLFLDEIGEMPMLAQVKLLRVLQEQEFERVGGTETVKVNVRVIAATNANLQAMSDDGRFRKDLFFRLYGYPITLPPLRERGEDIRLLIDFYLRRFEKEFAKPSVELPADTLTILESYPWPGNIRELQSVLRQAILRMSGNVLLPDFLPAQLTNTTQSMKVENPPEGTFSWDEFVNERIENGSESIYDEAVVRMEREVILRVLKHTEGNQLQAARMLGMTRGSLRTKIRALGISIGRDIWASQP